MCHHAVAAFPCGDYRFPSREIVWITQYDHEDARRRAYVLKPKKIAIFLLVVFAAFMITQAPNTSAQWVKDGLTVVGNGVEGLFDFFGALAEV